jgi:hypothetical protein
MRLEYGFPSHDLFRRMSGNDDDKMGDNEKGFDNTNYFPSLNG